MRAAPTCAVAVPHRSLAALRVGPAPAMLRNMELPGDPPIRFTYPVEYPVKIIGLADDHFAEHARRLVARVVGEAPPEQVTVRASAGGKYHSVTVTVTLTSEPQRLALYEALRNDPRVVHGL